MGDPVDCNNEPRSVHKYSAAEPIVFSALIYLDLTPAEVLRLGSFGGTYFRPDQVWRHGGALHHQASSGRVSQGMVRRAGRQVAARKQDV